MVFISFRKMKVVFIYKFSKKELLTKNEFPAKKISNGIENKHLP
jgi:hypothetical protein